MKYRKSHVTNSSSSSFVCDICGRVESGWDLSISEAGMCECINGHVFCEDEKLELSRQDMINELVNHGIEEYKSGQGFVRKYYKEEDLNDLTDDQIKDLLFPEGDYYELPECVCPICQFIEYSESDLCKYLEKTYHISRGEVFAEVKQLNKRRKKLYDSEYITYVCRKFALNPIEIVVGWKNEFNSYDEFKQWLNK